MHKFPPAIKRLAVYLRVMSVIFLWAVASIASAQVAGTATIQGTITDSTGAVIPNASIVLTETATQAKHAAISDTSGQYSFPNIEIGTYTATVKSAGFETYVKTGKMMPDDGLRQLQPYDAIFLGAVGHPSVPDHISLWGLLIPIRRNFHQYINLRPVRLLKGVRSPLAGRGPADRLD